MFNKFQRAILRATEKRCSLTNDFIDRYEMDSVKLNALCADKHVFSIGMETFRMALVECIIEDFTEV